MKDLKKRMLVQLIVWIAVACVYAKNLGWQVKRAVILGVYNLASNLLFATYLGLYSVLFVLFKAIPFLLEMLSTVTSKGVGRGLGKLKWPLTSIPPGYTRRWFEHPALVLLALVVGVVGSTLFKLMYKPSLPRFVGFFTPLALVFAIGAIVAVVKAIRPPPKGHGGVVLLPGSRVSWLLRLLCSKQAYQRVFEPIFADMQYEYVEAIKDGNKRDARLSIFRGYFGLIRTIPLSIVVGLAREIWVFWKRG